MNAAVAESYATADRVIANALKKAGDNPPCCKGCFHCCREPAYAGLSEVRSMLEALTPEQVAQVRAKTVVWLEKFMATDFADQDLPSANDYRRQLLWCPLLKDGECMAYERRPLCCRVHIAHKSKDACENDDLREHQKFASFPGLIEYVTQRHVQAMQIGEVEVNDHIGVLLANELLGSDVITANRMTIEVNADETLTIKSYRAKNETA